MYILPAKLNYLSIVALLLSALLFAGCSNTSNNPADTSVAAETAANDTAAAPLPNWAPDNPSPEFLRAAKVLKPLPPEMLQEFFAEAPGGEATIVRYIKTFPALYEFFGSFTDDQLKAFPQSDEIMFPVKDLSAPQRKALDNWFVAWEEHMKGAPPEIVNYRVLLYKLGAKEDFSNMKVGFIYPKSKIIHIQFLIRQPDGTEDGPCTGFALL